MLSDCPDYASLVLPPSTLPKKKFKLKVPMVRRDAQPMEEEEEEGVEEIRMCTDCKQLVDRYGMWRGVVLTGMECNLCRRGLGSRWDGMWFV